MSAPRTLAAFVPAVAGKALDKRGLALGALLTDWGTIVGPTLASRTIPYKITFPPGRREDAVLQVRVSGAYALEIQHAEPQIIERINGHFGFRAVGRLRLIQAPPQAPQRRAARARKLKPEEEAAIAETAGRVEDEGLREALARLGRAIRSQTP